MAASFTSDVSTLRLVCQDCLKKNSLRCAEFYADKLISLTYGNEEDVYLLGLIYHRLGQNHRMVHLFQKYNFLVDPKQEVILGQTRSKELMKPKFLLLAMEGLYQCKAFDDALKLTDYINDDNAYVLIKEYCKNSEEENAYELNYASSLCLVRGKIWEGIEHQDYAIRWYQRALKHDVKNFEAFSRLTERKMLSHDLELELLGTLENGAKELRDIPWLFLFYQSIIKQYDYGLKDSCELEPVSKSFQPWGLDENNHVLTIEANTFYNLNAFEECHHITSKIIRKSPFHEQVLAPHVCSLVELKLKEDLHYLAHQLVNRYPQRPISWFAVGAYYYLIENFEVARRHFNKATELDQHFAPAWIGFGHSFGYQDASDQAVAAYRTANRLFPGSHIPLVCIGMEYVRTQNLALAKRFFNQAKFICEYDPLIYNELAVIAYKNKNYGEAVSKLEHALEYCSTLSVEICEPIMYNLGHAYRKLKEYEKALEVYKKSLDMDSQNPRVITAMAFTYLLMNKFHVSILYCHKSLALMPMDSFTADVLKHALEYVNEDSSGFRQSRI